MYFLWFYNPVCCLAGLAIVLFILLHPYDDNTSTTILQMSQKETLQYSQLHPFPYFPMIRWQNHVEEEVQELPKKAKEGKGQ